MAAFLHARAQEREEVSSGNRQIPATSLSPPASSTDRSLKVNKIHRRNH